MMLLFILIWSIIGIAFFCIGIGLHARGLRKRSVCTRPVTAIVVDLQRERVGVEAFSVSGEAVELFVNPDRTDEFYCPTEKISCIQKVFTGVGVACLCLAVIMGVILYYCT